jgi:hypothetical protein
VAKTQRTPLPELPLNRACYDALREIGCGRDGYQRLVRPDRDQSRDNAPFAQLRRGDIVELSGTRVGKSTRVR